MQRMLLFGVLILLLNYPAYPDHCDHGPPRSCSDCYNDKSSSCVSGEMRIEEQTKGHIKVSQLSEGDIIRGIKGADKTPAWCKVEAVFPVPHSQNQTTYDGFTKSHMVVDSKGGSVHPYGKKGRVRNGPVFTLATECDAVVNSAGQAFSPISTAFCPHDLSWSEYLTLIAAVRSVTSRAGNFWFDLNAYHDNETAEVPRWLDQIPSICRELLRCARKDRCQKFEDVMNEFVHDHLNDQYLEVVERVFPNMGGDVEKEQAGTMTEVVRSQKSSDLVLFSAVGAAMVALLVVAVAILVYRRRIMKKTAVKKLEPKKTGDVLLA